MYLIYFPIFCDSQLCECVLDFTFRRFLQTLYVPCCEHQSALGIFRYSNQFYRIWVSLYISFDIRLWLIVNRNGKKKCVFFVCFFSIRCVWLVWLLLTYNQYFCFPKKSKSPGTIGNAQNFQIQHKTRI